MTVKCRTTIKALFLYFSVELDGFSCSFTFVSFIATVIMVYIVHARNVVVKIHSCFGLDII